MRIALIGAPGAGKQELASALAAKTGFRILDNPATHLAVVLDTVIDRDALWLTNMIIACQRIVEERVQSLQGIDFISTGTALDSEVYTMTTAEAYLRLPDEMQSADTRGQALKEMNATQVMHFAVMETLGTYDIIAYIPLPATSALKIVGDEALKQPDDYAKLFDKGLQVVFQRLGITPLELRGSIEQKVDTLMEAIDEVRGESVSGDGEPGLGELQSGLHDPEAAGS